MAFHELASECSTVVNQIHTLTKSSLTEDISFIKGCSQSYSGTALYQGPYLGRRVRAGAPPTHPPTPSASSVATASNKEREVIVKLDSPESAALLRLKTS